ncbi:MAG TPA: hypothetical protein VJT67_03590, partial [Longimicrobiaceae bacterium]|nr:hypothetical protein [Longimicrobiaceae bacterium]
MLRSLRSLAIPAALALSAALAACGDAPTNPTSFSREAGGRTWVAIAEPAGLPDARTWLPYLPPDASAQVRAMVGEARAMRRDGKLE